VARFVEALRLKPEGRGFGSVPDGVIGILNANWFGHIMRRNCLLRQVIEGKIKRRDRSDRKTRKET
jgi:hypothetical protein